MMACPVDPQLASKLEGRITFLARVGLLNKLQAVCHRVGASKNRKRRLERHAGATPKEVGALCAVASDL